MQIVLTSSKGTSTVSFTNSIKLDDALVKAGIKIPHPCAGKGTCGKCRVTATGELSPLSAEEKRLLSPKDISENIRLACCTTAHGDAQVQINDSDEQIKGVTAGYFPDFNKNPLSGDKSCYAMAVDIGTTTIAGYFYKLPECTCIKSLSRTNPQTQFGADVISRIQYSNEGGLSDLKAAVNEAIDSMRLDFGKPIEYSVITGNTTMLHLLTGLDPAGIAAAPFTPQSLFGEWQEDVYFPPCISAYVGADITTAILNSDMLNDNSSLLVDIGTNGEMAYWDGEKLTCCSTAAGPAFEGAGISCGMPAVPGAIDKVWLDDNNALMYHTIDGAPPVGICGSGLMDAAACLLKNGTVEDTGYADGDCFIGESGIALTTGDIRQIQLAKSAIRAGIETLLGENSAPECVYIAGGFGSYVDIESCIRIGLLPDAFRGRIKVLGNAAGNGAAMILESKECLESAEKIAEAATTKELSALPEFMDNYMEHMLFPAE